MVPVKNCLPDTAENIMCAVTIFIFDTFHIMLHWKLHSPNMMSNVLYLQTLVAVFLATLLFSRACFLSRDSSSEVVCNDKEAICTLCSDAG